MRHLKPTFRALFGPLGSAVSRLWRDTRGNVLMITGLALIPLTIATGMAIDYSRASRLETKLNAAADAAALAGTTKPMMNQSILAACNASRRSFRNALEQKSNGLTFVNATDLTISITETYAGGTTTTQTCPIIDATVPAGATLPNVRLVTVTYKGLSNNAFAGVLGSSTIPIGGTSTARSSTATYYQIIFLVDVSNSMGIGGTASDITSLQNDNTIACAFACHDPNGTIPVSASGWCDGSPLDYFCRTGGRYYCPWGAGNCGIVNPSKTYSDRRALAKLYGYKLKIDYVNDAVTSFINALQSKMTASPNNYLVSVSTFGTSYAQLQAPTTSWTTLQTGAGKIDLEVAARSPAGYANQGWTYTSTGLQTLRTGLTNVGDGTSATARKTYVIFMSDGVEDTFDASDPLGMYNRVTSYNYLAQCTAMKNAGVTMFSIETAYPVIANDSQYTVLVTNLPSRNNGFQIADAMKGCASSDSRYFMASDGPGITTATNSVFGMINAETSRLSQ